MRAALLTEADVAFAIVDDLEVAEPRAGQVRVRVTHCGLCPDGTSPFTWHDQVVYRGNGIGALTELTVVDAAAAIKVPDDTPLDLACLIGCAIQTGVGAVLNAADVPAGATVLVMGLGGI